MHADASLLSHYFLGVLVKDQCHLFQAICHCWSFHFSSPSNKYHYIIKMKRSHAFSLTQSLYIVIGVRGAFSLFFSHATLLDNFTFHRLVSVGILSNKVPYSFQCLFSFPVEMVRSIHYYRKRCACVWVLVKTQKTSLVLPTVAIFFLLSRSETHLIQRRLN